MERPPASALGTLLTHEWRIASRGFIDFITRRSGRGGGLRLLLLLVAIIALAHAIAFGLTHGAPAYQLDDYAGLVALSGILAFAFLMMLSAGLDSAAFTLYSRADYEMLFASPVPPAAIFLIRALNVFVFTGAKVLLYGAPFFNMMAVKQGAHWLYGYAVLLAMAALATMLAVALAMGLVAAFGVKRTRVLAQVLAAFVGLGVFVFAQREMLLPDGVTAWFGALVANSGDATEFWLWPARALLGDGFAAVILPVLSVVASAAGLALLAGPFVRATVLAAGAPVEQRQKRRAGATRFDRSLTRVLAAQERRMILRDPWLLSQILTQCLFLLPLTVIAAQTVFAGSGDAVLFVPMYVVLAGQIAGGLTFVALSADDAPDLLASAPVAPAALLTAKLIGVGYLTILFVSLPLIGIALLSAKAGAFALFGMLLGVGATVMINLWHQPRPGPHVRRQRRHAGSTLINFAEMIVLIVIAGAVWMLTQNQVSAAGLLGAIAGIALVALRMGRKRPIADHPPVERQPSLRPA
jgi:ABC-2 type transport system permease protein